MNEALPVTESEMRDLMWRMQGMIPVRMPDYWKGRGLLDTQRKKRSAREPYELSRYRGGKLKKEPR